MSPQGGDGHILGSHTLQVKPTRPICQLERQPALSKGTMRQSQDLNPGTGTSKLTMLQSFNVRFQAVGLVLF